MMKEKGVWDLLEACKQLSLKNYEFHCDFVGKWNDIDKQTFDYKIKEYKLEKNTTAHGPKYGNNKQYFFERANIFVFPTYYHNECFPLVLLEAMEYGLPCISTNEGGIPEIILDGKNGFLVNKKSPDELFNKISFLIENPKICNEMGDFCKQYFSNKFTLESFNEKFISIIKQILI